jgi:hypothetical protein
LNICSSLEFLLFFPFSNVKKSSPARKRRQVSRRAVIAACSCSDHCGFEACIERADVARSIRPNVFAPIAIRPAVRISLTEVAGIMVLILVRAHGASKRGMNDAVERRTLWKRWQRGASAQLSLISAAG